ncbi:hypothetical protein DITRI_Ditri10aG0122900 [Diplodiscus trichospermus]
MAKQRIASFFLAIVLIFGANVLFCTASFPTLLTSNYGHKSRPTKLIGWDTPGPEPAHISPSPSPQPQPVPGPPYFDHGIKGGYWPSWLAYSLPPSSIPTMYFTHVFYAFVGLDASSYNLSITQPDDQWMANFTATLQAKNPPAKAMLSIGGANAGSGTFSNMVGNPDNRAAFIKSTIATARKYGFDGLDFDWEFPSNQDDMSNLSVFFKEWRQAVETEASSSGKPPLLLSAAVYFAYRFFFNLPRTYPGHAIAKYLDFVNPMCFDYHGSWDPSVTGMPLYGRTWKLKDPKQHGIGAPADGVGPGNNGVLLYNDIVTYNAEHHAQTVYDGDTVSEYSCSGTDWIGYDGPKSVEKKIEYAKANHLGGYFFWALGYDMNWNLSATGRFSFQAAVSNFFVTDELRMHGTEYTISTRSWKLDEIFTIGDFHGA